MPVAHHIAGLSMISVYAVDFEASLAFYRDVLGLTNVQPMGEQAAYLRFGQTLDAQGEDAPFGLYLIGGNAPLLPGKLPTRTTFAFDVVSVRGTFDHLKATGTRIDMDEPMDMGGGHFWFTAYDPSGLPIEFVGQA